MTDWTGLVTRVRARSAHLLPEAELDAIEACASLSALQAELGRTGYIRGIGADGSATVQALEGAVRRVAARHVATLARWTLGAPDVLAPFTLAEDLRSIGACVRGAVAKVGEDDKRRGLIPTPTLPARALEQLAALSGTAEIGALLTAWGHPFAAVVAEHARHSRLDLFLFDRDLFSAWVAACARAAKAWGDASVRAFVGQTIDLANLTTARLLAEQRTDASVPDLFVRGGSVVTVDDLSAAVQSHDVGPLAARLASRTDGATAPLAALLTPTSIDPEGDALAALIADFDRRARRNPLDLASLVVFFLRLRNEQRRLMRAISSCALGLSAPVPGSAREAA